MLLSIFGYQLIKYYQGSQIWNKFKNLIKCKYFKVLDFFYHHVLLSYLTSLPRVKNRSRLWRDWCFDQIGFPKLNPSNPFEEDVYPVADSISLSPFAFLATNVLADDELFFCGKVDQQKETWADHHMLQAKFEPTQNLISGVSECCISLSFFVPKEKISSSF